MYQGDERWIAVDDYFAEKLAPSDQALKLALEANTRAGLPPHDVSPLQGKLLALLAKLVRAERILEIGTLGGYSTIWLARALRPNGKVISLELSPECAHVARQNIDLAGVGSQVDIVVGPALTSLARLYQAGGEPFDLIFIDADKPNNPAYFQWALKLARVGAVIIGDNVVRDGAVINPHSLDDRVQGVRAFTDLLAGSTNVFSTALQTVGQKGWDGLTISIVEGLE
jgi:predicted O-methyltransferase YrrM